MRPWLTDRSRFVRNSFHGHACPKMVRWCLQTVGGGLYIKQTSWHVQNHGEWPWIEVLIASSSKHSDSPCVFIHLTSGRRSGFICMRSDRNGVETGPKMMFAWDNSVCMHNCKISIYIYTYIWYPSPKVYLFHGQSGHHLYIIYIYIYIYIYIWLLFCNEIKGKFLFWNVKNMQNQKTSRKPKKSNQYSISLAKVEKQKKHEQTKTSTKKIKETIFQKSGERVYSQESWNIRIFSLLVFLFSRGFLDFCILGLPRVQEYCFFRLFLIFVFFSLDSLKPYHEKPPYLFFFLKSLPARNKHSGFCLFFTIESWPKSWLKKERFPFKGEA